MITLGIILDSSTPRKMARAFWNHRVHTLVALAHSTQAQQHCALWDSDWAPHAMCNIVQYYGMIVSVAQSLRALTEHGIEALGSTLEFGSCCQITPGAEINAPN